MTDYADLKRRLVEVSLDAEEWLPIDFGNGNYFVSNLGRVFSLPRWRTKGGIVALSVASGNYRRVCLYDRNAETDTHIKHTFLVHTLVAKAFIGPRPKGFQIAHGNGDRADNRAANLSYKTPKENDLDKDIHKSRLFGEANGSSKLTIEQVRDIRQRTDFQINLAAKYGVARSTIQRIQMGRGWQNLT